MVSSKEFFNYLAKANENFVFDGDPYACLAKLVEQETQLELQKRFFANQKELMQAGAGYFPPAGDGYPTSN